MPPTSQRYSTTKCQYVLLDPGIPGYGSWCCWLNSVPLEQYAHGAQEARNTMLNAPETLCSGHTVPLNTQLPEHCTP